MASGLRTCCLITSVVLFILGLLLIAGGIVVMVVVLPETIRQQVRKEMVLKKNDDGSFNELTRDWMNPNYLSYMQYWIFNYTNPTEIVNRGMNPDVREKGPYSYRETIANDKVQFDSDGTQLSFVTRKTYVFDPETSCPTCKPDEYFVFPDIAFVSAMDLLTDADKLCETLGIQNCTTGFDSIGQTILDAIAPLLSVSVLASDGYPFINQTVKSILFDGYPEPILTELLPNLIEFIHEIGTHHIDPPDIPNPKIALNLYNATDSATFRILSGTSNFKDVGQILEFSSVGDISGSYGSWLNMSWWHNPDNESCPEELDAIARKLMGTNGDFFHPEVKKSDILYTYSSDICRTIYLTYQKEVKVRGIPAWRFALPTSSFSYDLPENCGYCHPTRYQYYGRTNDPCLPSGLLDLSHCQPDNPSIAVSLPHFTGAAREVQRFVPRLKSQGDDDMVLVDIEPTTGTVLAANKRLQINLMMHDYPKVTAFKAMKGGAYPIVWLNETYLLDDSTKRKIEDNLINPQKLVRLICWIVGVGLGTALVIAGIVTFALALVCCGEKEAKDYDVNGTPAMMIGTVSAIPDDQRQ